MSLRRSALALVAAIGAVIAWGGAGSAQPGGGDEPKTLKERLSDKGSDEQRVDNCKVPLARRGMTPRPDCGERPTPTPALARRQ